MSSIIIKAGNIFECNRCKPGDGTANFITVESDTISPIAVKLVANSAALTCVLTMRKPTMLMVQQFGYVQFNFSSAHRGDRVTMIRDGNRPYPFLLPFLNIPLYTRLIRRFGGNRWHLNDAQLSFARLHEMGIAGSAMTREHLDAGVQWGILTRYGHSLQWHARKWVLNSMEDDLIDAQAKQEGYDA